MRRTSRKVIKCMHYPLEMMLSLPTADADISRGGIALSVRYIGTRC